MTLPPETTPPERSTPQHNLASAMEAAAKQAKKAESAQTEELRELFGREAAEIAPFVSCGDKDRNFLVTVCPAQTKNVFLDKKSNGDFPLWLIGDQLYAAAEEISLVDAAKLTDFQEFPLSTLRKETDFEGTRYIWM
ncbi:hypothetical protein AK812_SmicGene36953 [Symbiodinium microadriaticum]|uniref:Uncharacterized protein n=1 Tax=Symbiodinium microadriaticum TaxID=2951 RepID=A0A1Q9CHI4_SYMMI|nr:hypothetical protein AK812_SmicGene36953 [Symbiodinium microadriaticum]